jgi:hypothetical protein
MPRLMRQAVLVIHGVGEQKPMETLRSFVSAVLPDVGVFSKPDTISLSYELRRLTTKLKPQQATDFFELYWADKVEGTVFRHILQWLRGLLFRIPARVPAHLRALWFVTWLLLVVIAALIVAIYVARDAGVIDAKTAILWAVLGPLVLSVPHGMLLYYLGDAARYLSPSPQNVATRRAIREAGVDILRRLHSTGKYDRIVLVGHSLGSVIAYDILCYYWAEVNTSFTDPVRLPQERLAALERLLYTTDEAVHTPVAQYRRLQRDLWIEMFKQGHVWRITDLITLGSPLAHAAILLARDEVDLIQKMRDRELPTNPPQPDEEAGLSYVLDPPLKNFHDELVSPRVPHHAAAFCCVRWTNIFYPAKAGLFGDLVGGPLTSLFGEGIRDIALTSGGWWRHTVLAHTRYWHRQVSSIPGSPVDASAALIGALDLDWSSLSSSGP